MGEVYRARDARLGREVALKVIPDRLKNDPEALTRFQREARAASALNHPHIVTIYDIGRERVGGEDVSYYTMELIDGTTLRERVGRDSLTKILNYFVQIADGLAKAHGAGILHRDLKPENVMVSVDGYAKVVDFGLAKMQPMATDDTRSPTAVADSAVGSVVGTVSYMSPEQVEGRPVDARSDVFSFGSMLYEALTGKRPFDSRTPVDTMHAIAHATPAPLIDSGRAIPADLQRIVARCLAKAPEDRYQSIKEAAIELRSVIREIESGAAQPIVRRRPRWPALIAGAIVLIVIVAIIVKRPWQPKTTATSIQSLAILPFQNATRNPDADYISDGITDDIINSLSQLPNIRVLARSTVFRYKKKEDDPRAIGKDLGVDALVLGELRQLRDMVNIKVELVRTSDGTQLWG
ncbi:MAG TPA: serine/threonine-protein kinase, partial [Thermoanaerobaculia bacterium]